MKNDRKRKKTEVRQNNRELYKVFQSALTDQCGSVGWASSHELKGHRSDSRSRHMPRLQVRSTVGACMRGSQTMFLSCIDISLPFFLPPSSSFLILFKKLKFANPYTCSSQWTDRCQGVLGETSRRSPCRTWSSSKLLTHRIKSK